MKIERPLLGVGLLAVLAACSSGQRQVVPYVVNTTCSGGGGIYSCSATNPTPNRLGPFDLDFEFFDDRGVSLGRSTVTNTEGLEPKGEWAFTVTGSPRTRRINSAGVHPR